MNEEILFFFFSGGIINGLILSTILFFEKPRPLSNRILASLLLLMSVELFSISFFDKLILTNIGTLGQLVLITVINFNFLYGILFYFYVKSSVFDRFKFQKRDLMHLIPFGLFFLIGILLLQMPQSSRDYPLLSVLFQYCSLLQGIIGFIYTIIAFRLLNYYANQTENNFSNLSRYNIQWIRRISIIQICLWLSTLLGTIEILYTRDHLNSTVLIEIFYLGITTLILITGYTIFRHPNIFHFKLSYEDFQKKQQDEERRLKAEIIQSQYQALQHKMAEEKPYEDPDLTLSKLSDMTQIPAYLLSEMLNRYAGKNFFNFVNHFRIEAVKQKLESNQTDSIFSIAMNSGFNSKSTFNSLFKKYTGMTPSQYRDRMSQIAV